MNAGQQDKKQIERVVVFCGSKLGKNPLYAEHAAAKSGPGPSSSPAP